VRPAAHGAGECTLQESILANGEILRLRVCRYKSRDYLDLRRWYTDADGELKPSSKGILFDSELAPELAELLTQLVEAS